MAHQEDAGPGSINRRDSGTVRAEYAAWLAEQPLSTRTREAYLAAVTAFITWLEHSRTAGRCRCPLAVHCETWTLHPPLASLGTQPWHRVDEHAAARTPRRG